MRFVSGGFLHFLFRLFGLLSEFTEAQRQPCCLAVEGLLQLFLECTHVAVSVRGAVDERSCKRCSMYSFTELSSYLMRAPILHHRGPMPLVRQRHKVTSPTPRKVLAVFAEIRIGWLISPPVLEGL